MLLACSAAVVFPCRLNGVFSFGHSEGSVNVHMNTQTRLNMANEAIHTQNYDTAEKIILVWVHECVCNGYFAYLLIYLYTYISVMMFIR
jgi:hypothetical protein